MTFEIPEGHGKPCSYCGEDCNSLAANPGLWPLYFPDPDQKGTGKGRWHHTSCVVAKIAEVEESQLAALAGEDDHD